MAILMGIRGNTENKKECTKKVEGLMSQIKETIPEKIPYSYEMQRLLGITGSDDENHELREAIKTGNYKYGLPARLLILLGQLPHTENGKETDEVSTMFNQRKYLFMLDAPFEVSNMCCKIMKKDPAHRYAKETGRVPITAMMASESRLRASQWLKNGCNGFDMKAPISNPLSFWTEQDILLYIKQNNLPICSVYGDIVEDLSGTDEVEGQLTISDLEGYENMELFDAKRPPLKTTGCKRTGCMLCGFGCHLDKAGEGRFELLKKTHPKMYNLLDLIKNNGVTFREAIEWMNEHGNLNIRL